MTDLDRAIVSAACDVRMQTGKDRMVDMAISLAMDISYRYNMDDSAVEDMIWDRV